MTQYGPGVPLVVHWWLQEAEEPGHGVVLVLVFEFRTDSNFRAKFLQRSQPSCGKISWPLPSNLDEERHSTSHWRAAVSPCPGSWMEQYTGEVYIQELASMLPVEAATHL
jgi:hypothetical protein